MLSLTKHPCPLCGCDEADHFSESHQRHFFKCTHCQFIFTDRGQLLSAEEEKARYDLHQNDIADIRYQHFVQPLVDQVTTAQQITQKGLDYGCGPGPVISYMLRKLGYGMTTYDPFYCHESSALTQKYDFIVCCEVIEHFFHPAEQFILLRQLLKPRGRLYIMTSLWTESLAFETWHYQRDPTHVAFYCLATLNWIAQHHHFKAPVTDGHRLVILEASGTSD